MNTVEAGSYAPPERNTLRVERAAQALVGADEDDGAPADLAHLEQRVREVDRPRRRQALDAVEQPRERTRAIAACCALRIFEAATICIALVICAVLLIDRMRRRMSRGWPWLRIRAVTSRATTSSPA